jgi:hypothetical protein
MANYLLKSKRKKRKYDRKIKICEFASYYFLKYGSLGYRYSKFNEEKAQTIWHYNEPVPDLGRLMFIGFLKNYNIKWYIQNKIEYHDKIWNGSFIHGLSRYGKLRINEEKFPSLEWRNHPELAEIIFSCPFGGNHNRISYSHDSLERAKWSVVPAFYLPYDESSISFMAGCLASTRIFKSRGQTYLLANNNIYKEILKMGIPIEHISANERKCLISPFWHALFSLYMPESCRYRCLNLPNAYRANLYAAIIWKVYGDNRFKSQMIPYLQGRRSIFYKYKTEDRGAFRNLELMRLEYGLTNVHNNIRSLVFEWKKMYNKEERKKQ